MQQKPLYFTKNSITFSNKSDNAGFSLIEVIIATVVLLVDFPGVFTVFTFTINYNAGNNSRAQALSVLQRETELLRCAKFTPFMTDADLTGGGKPPKFVVSGDGSRFVVNTVVDDDPFIAGTQTNVTNTLKEVTVTVSLESPTPGWQTAVPIITVLRRVKAN